jgi:hypothetical protein
MNNRLKRWWPRVVVGLFGLSTLALTTSLALYFSRTEQWRLYDLGQKAYTARQYGPAAEYFEASAHEYEMTAFIPAGLLKAFTSPPSLEMAARAWHFKGLADAKLGTDDKMAASVEAFKATTGLTTKRELDQAEKNGRLDPSRRSAVEALRLGDQQNIELVQNNKQELAKREGKGRGREGGEEKTEPASPGDAAGKPSRDDL